MTRGLTYALVGLSLIVLVALVSAGAFEPAPWYAVVALIVLACLAAAPLARQVQDHVRDRRAIRAMRTDTDLSAVARRLQGDYAPYVIEAAQEIAASGNPAAAPLLLRALEALLDQQPPGWRGMVGAMAAALASVRETSSLPLLQRARRLAGLEEIEGLAESIASIERSANLLRPAVADDELLRPAGVDKASSDPDTLLRAERGTEP